MIHQLPRWVSLGAWVLALMAGMINAVGYLSFEHQAVTHLTGTTTLLATTLAQGQFSLGGHLLGVIAAFMGGAVVSALIIRDSTLKLGRRYSVVLMIEAAALCLAVPALEHEWVWGTYLAGAACGLQNAMATTYSGTVIRTSHITGMLTDLGIFIGHALRGIAVEPRRLQFCLIVISGFFAGGLIGACSFSWMSVRSLYWPAGLAAGVAIAYEASKVMSLQRPKRS